MHLLNFVLWTNPYIESNYMLNLWPEYHSRVMCIRIIVQTLSDEHCSYVNVPVCACDTFFFELWIFIFVCDSWLVLATSTFGWYSHLIWVLNVIPTCFCVCYITVLAMTNNDHSVSFLQTYKFTHICCVSVCVYFFFDYLLCVSCWNICIWDVQMTVVASLKRWQDHSKLRYVCVWFCYLLGYFC